MDKVEKDIKKFDDIDLSSNIEIYVGNFMLPLKIGDKIDIGDGVIRVVMKIQINEDTKVTYGLQWIDGIGFKLDWFSWPEICHMSEIFKHKPKVGI